MIDVMWAVLGIVVGYVAGRWYGEMLTANDHIKWLIEHNEKLERIVKLDQAIFQRYYRMEERESNP